jgi:hypothetical protein
LTGERADTPGKATVRQELKADIVDGVSAEALARQTLAGVVDANQAFVMQWLRVTQDSVTAATVTKLSADMQTDSSGYCG